MFAVNIDDNTAVTHWLIGLKIVLCNSKLYSHSLLSITIYGRNSPLS